MNVAAHDPGGKVRRGLPAGVHGWATFSKCGRYRRALGRDDWTMTPYKEGIVLFCGMNPSTAEGDVDDPTIIREFGFTRNCGLPQLCEGQRRRLPMHQTECLIGSGHCCMH